VLSPLFILHVHLLTKYLNIREKLRPHSCFELIVLKKMKLIGYLCIVVYFQLKDLFYFYSNFSDFIIQWLRISIVKTFSRNCEKYFDFSLFRASANFISSNRFLRNNVEPTEYELRHNFNTYSNLLIYLVKDANYINNHSMIVKSK